MNRSPTKTSDRALPNDTAAESPNAVDAFTRVLARTVARRLLEDAQETNSSSPLDTPPGRTSGD